MTHDEKVTIFYGKQQFIVIKIQRNVIKR